MQSSNALEKLHKLQHRVKNIIYEAKNSPSFPESWNRRLIFISINTYHMDTSDDVLFRDVEQNGCIGFGFGFGSGFDFAFQSY